MTKACVGGGIDDFVVCGGTITRRQVELYLVVRLRISDYAARTDQTGDFLVSTVPYKVRTMRMCEDIDSE